MNALVLFLWLVGVIALALFIALLALVNATLDLLRTIQADLVRVHQQQLLKLKRERGGSPLGLS